MEGASAANVIVPPPPAAPVAASPPPPPPPPPPPSAPPLLIASSSSPAAAVVAESPKVPMLASKAGMNFVIPKNKLSGALVPVTRGSKWEPEEKKDLTLPPPRKTKWGPDLTQDAAVKRGRALALQTRAEQLAAQLESGNLEPENSEATRSPSPPPIYDALGHRMNTREGRKREQLDVERREAIGECIKLNPFYKPPSGYKSVAKEAKLFIPSKEHPGYNFIGQILGPRGLTQKRMEAETGAKITIRGKGAVKEGKLHLVRPGSKDIEGAYEDLHVHIAADTFEKVDAAVSLIQPLLTPVDEERNIHKMKQLRELAEMNGTVRDFTKVCTFCGEAGHKEWHCPRDKLQTFQAKVICRLCGDGSHPTVDCPLKFSGQGKVIDKEYLNFLEELGGGLGGIDPMSKGDETHPPGAEPSGQQQPMLLTASGAQPMPDRWPGVGPPPGTALDGLSDGAFPRFPFPIPPPGTPGRGGFEFFLQRFFHPSMLNLFRGRPPTFPFPPASLQMMARMFPAFRGRFPMPPFGPRPDMRPPQSSTEHDSQPSFLNGGDSQEPGFTAGGALYANRELLVDESHAAGATSKAGQKEDIAPLFAPLSMPPAVSSTSTASPFSTSTTSMPTSGSTLWSGMPLPSGPPPDLPPSPMDTSVPPPAPSSMAGAPPASPSGLPLAASLPPIMPPSATILSGMVPVRPLPSIRPVARPGAPAVAHAQFVQSGGQAPNFTPLSSLGGQDLTNPAGSAVNLSNSLQPWNMTGSATSIWPQGQESQLPPSQRSPQPLTSQEFSKYSSEVVDKSFSLTPAQSFPSQNAPTLSSVVVGESPLKAWGSAPFSSTLPPGGPGLTPGAPPPLASSHMQPFPRAPPPPPVTPSSIPPPFSSFVTPHHQISHNSYQLPAPSANLNQLPQSSLLPSLYSSGLVNPVYSPSVGQQGRPVTSPGPPVSSLMQPSQSFLFQSDLPGNPRSQYLPQSSYQNDPFQIQDSRPWQTHSTSATVAPFGLSQSAELRAPSGYMNAGWVASATSFSPSSDSGRGFSYDPSMPKQSSASASMFQYQPDAMPRTAPSQDYWHPKPANIQPSIQQQSWPQPQAGTFASGGSKWVETPSFGGVGSQTQTVPSLQTQEVDPEYEKLMASVGVL